MEGLAMKKYYSLVLISVLCWMIPSGLYSQAPEDSTIISLMKEYSERLAKFNVLDSAALTPKYSAIIVEGLADRNGTAKDWDDLKKLQVFGVFIINNKTHKLHLTIDIFYTTVVYSMGVAIDKHGRDYLIISKMDDFYGFPLGKVKYFFDVNDKLMIKKVEFQDNVVNSLIVYHGSLYFLILNGYRSILGQLLDVNKYEDASQYSFATVLGGDTLLLYADMMAIEDSLYLISKYSVTASGKWAKKFVLRTAGWQRLGHMWEKYYFLFEKWRPVGDPFTENISDRYDYTIEQGGISIRVGNDTTFYEAPPYTYKKFKELRPDADIYQDVQPGISEGDSIIFPAEICCASAAGGAIWFGTRFYGGEGCNGLGCIGRFDLDSRNYEMYYLKEIVDYSISAIYANRNTVLAGLVYYPEGGNIPGGLVVFDIETQRVIQYPVSEVITSVCISDRAYLVGTTDALYFIRQNRIARITPDFNINQEYYVDIDTTFTFPQK
jgi:hypothetical protein